MKKKIGILGGTFNPVHLGHLILAQNAMETCDLSNILFVPCASPPHKKSTALVAPEHRVAMLRNAVEHDPRFEVSMVEIERGGISYAVDTVEALKELHPDATLYFVIGGDTLPELYLWKDISRLLEMCVFVTFARLGKDLDKFMEQDLMLDPPWSKRLLENVFSTKMVDISSSDIRHRVAEGMSIRYLVPELVEMYISEHSLYSNDGGRR